MKHNTDMSKFISVDQAVGHIKEGMTLMIGGFLANGSAEKVVDALADKGTRHLTVIANDTAYPDRGIGKLLANGQIDKLIVSYIGATPVATEMMNDGRIEIEFVPQGTLAERVRAGGCGLGGFLTPTGLGTVVAEGKETITVDGKPYLLEKPLRADLAVIGATVADEDGNLLYKGTAQNFNPLMAMAAETVIAEPKEIVKTGEIAPEAVRTPAVLVDYIVK